MSSVTGSLLAKRLVAKFVAIVATGTGLIRKRECLRTKVFKEIGHRSSIRRSLSLRLRWNPPRAGKTVSLAGANGSLFRSPVPCSPYRMSKLGELCT
jgi:hypothetical protein